MGKHVLVLGKQHIEHILNEYGDLTWPVVSITDMWNVVSITDILCSLTNKGSVVIYEQSGEESFIGIAKLKNGNYYAMYKVTMHFKTEEDKLMFMLEHL